VYHEGAQGRERQRLVEVAQVEAALDQLAADEQAGADGEAREQQRGGAGGAARDPETCSGSMRAQDWWVVTVEPALESSEELELESSVESVESWLEEEDEELEVVVVVEEVTAACCVDAEVSAPMEPS
jgi:phage repressor protein C with HTH and peptisase S24 domain